MLSEFSHRRRERQRISLRIELNPVWNRVWTGGDPKKNDKVSIHSGFISLNVNQCFRFKKLKINIYLFSSL